jgi:hypothetical protein
MKLQLSVPKPALDMLSGGSDSLARLFRTVVVGTTAGHTHSATSYKILRANRIPHEA